MKKTFNEIKQEYEQAQKTIAELRPEIIHMELELKNGTSHSTWKRYYELVDIYKDALYIIEVHKAMFAE